MPTQEERRAASQAALLEATVDCLAEGGYATLSTREISRRAGVAQGTQRHYWPTKAGLLMAAMRHAKAGLAVRALERLRTLGPLDATSVAQGVDLAWELHRGREFRALQALWQAAADDRDVADVARSLEAEIQKELLDTVAVVFPNAAEHPDARAVLETGLAAVRGVVALAPLLDDDELEARWQPVRTELIRMVSSRLERTGAGNRRGAASRRRA
ncbi:MAG: helix-turn-helix domain-containing protein [Nitriliruptorales bacterium]|nr:helix-turn-helix domain-containing protein [Nitriliruptorales bacterium]